MRTPERIEDTPPSGNMAPPSGNMAPPCGNVAPPTGNMAPPSGDKASPVTFGAQLAGCGFLLLTVLGMLVVWTEGQATTDTSTATPTASPPGTPTPESLENRSGLADPP